MTERSDIDRQREEHDRMMQEAKTESRQDLGYKEQVAEAAEQNQSTRQGLAEKAGVNQAELAEKDQEQAEAQREEETEDERHGQDHGGHEL